MDEQTPDNSIPADARIAKIGSTVGIVFVPPIVFDSQRATKLGNALSEVLPISGMSIESNRWLYTSGSQGNGITVGVTPAQIEVTLLTPPPAKTAQEWFENRCVLALEQVAKELHPQIVAQSYIVLRGLVLVKGDSRTFIAEQLLGSQAKKMQLLKRPIQGFGLRFVLPPFQMSTHEGGELKADWLAEVKVESFLADPSQLFIEVTARWQIPSPWDVQFARLIEERLVLVADFVEKQLMPYIRQENGEHHD